MTILTTNTALRHHSPYDINLSVLVFHVSKVPPHTQVKAIYSQPYFRMYISAAQSVRNIGIAVFDGMAVFSGLAYFRA